ncbi:uncharacterized protein LOC105689294 [Athalia rosae]|uniref:uncharacterized protein LOC105689294 n=1 Tax=Athalia rosae TaxID=37344 RepID=UPI000A0ED661|nr:uncharacterized protein LOC105689294 [Athalia rosae]
MSESSGDPGRVHGYTNPSFCRQSEFISDENNADLPPPLQFQGDDLPPPPPPIQQQHHQHAYGQSNPVFHTAEEPVSNLNTVGKGRYVYLSDEPITQIQNQITHQVNHRRYGSLPVQQELDPQISKYDYIPEGEPHRQQLLQRHGSSRYAYIPSQQTQQQQVQFQHCIGSSPRSIPPVNQDDTRRLNSTHQVQVAVGRYAEIPVEQNFSSQKIISHERNYSPGPNQSSTSTARGRYARIPLQEEDPPALPERNGGSSVSPRNNPATQKLHEILTTPRKVGRSRSEERTLSPKRQQHIQGNNGGTPQRRALTPGSSPSGRTLSPGPRITPQGTPQGRTFSPNHPQTSTPNKDQPSARRCLPLTELTSSSMNRGGQDQQQQSVCPASNCGRLRYVGTAPVDLTELSRCEPPPRYAYLDGPGPESVPMICSSPRYQVVPTSDMQKRTGYQSVESAFVARTAVVPPLSPPNSDANTTLASGLDKNERRNAPLLLILVGVLTCGLSLYLSWTQGRRYYFDSAAGCGACCALAGACRSLKRTWTGFGLAALSALSCAGLLLLALTAPRSGTPLHDVTAGALCGVSLLGAALALLALIAPRCDLGRHRRVHSWIPNFSP